MIDDGEVIAEIVSATFLLGGKNKLDTQTTKGAVL